MLGFYPTGLAIGSQRCKKLWVVLVQEERLSRKKLSPERRRWQRLPLAIPVFIRCQDENGKDILEFATALNVSAGGMLVAVRRMLPDVEQYSLEVPDLSGAGDQPPSPVGTSSSGPPGARSPRPELSFDGTEILACPLVVSGCEGQFTSPM